MDDVRERLTSVSHRFKSMRPPKITKEDALAGVTTGIANVPDGMASAVLAGVNPVYGIYTLIAGTPVAALAVSTRLMMFNTTSAMTLVAVDGLGTRQGDDRVAALITIALIAGVFQLALGLLGLGMITKFVSNSVMVGFLTGISVLIVLGQLWDLTGYVGEGGGRLEKTAQLLSNIRDVDVVTSIVGIGSLLIMVLLSRTRLGNYNLLIALAVAVAAVWISSPDSVVLVSSLGEIPRALPTPELPQLTLIPKMLLTGIAVGAVGLLQAAGVAQAYPNTDGTDNEDSRDFFGQGLGNISSSMFQGMAGGGSVSGTALLVGAGARSQWASVIHAGVVIVVVLLFGGLLSRIPMAALAALLIYSAILSIKVPAISMVLRTSRTSLAGMFATFLATLVMPLQQAVMVGIALASILFLYRASSDIRLKRIRIENDRLVVSDPPAELPSNEVIVLDVDGNLFYAGARTLGTLLPDAKTAHHTGVVMRIRGQSEIGSTFFKVIGKYASELRARNSVLLLAGVEPEAKQRMKRAALLDQIGEDRVFLAGSIVGESTSDALRAGAAWLESTPPPISPVAAPDKDELTSASPPPVTTVSGQDHPSAHAFDGSIRRDVLAAIARATPNPADLSGRAVVLAGVLLVAIGLAAVIFTEQMLHLLMPFIGTTFVAIGAFWCYSSVVERADPDRANEPFRLVSAGVAITTGVGLFVQPFTDYVSMGTAQVLMAIGLSLLGCVGVIAAYRLNDDPADRTANITASLSLIVLALLTLLTLERQSSPVALIGWLVLVAGVATLVYAGVRAYTQGGSTDSATLESPE